VLGFETARLRMRPLDAGDQALYAELYTDPDTMRFICAPLSAHRARRSFSNAIARPRPAMGPFLFAVCARFSELAIGICAAVALDLKASRGEVGVMLKSHARGQGFAREALRGMVRHTFQSHPVDTIWVECSGLNPLVERMVESIGFVLDDAGSAGVGPLLQRTWSVRRSSWCSVDTANYQGESDVERDRVS